MYKSGNEITNMKMKFCLYRRKVSIMYIDVIKKKKEEE